MSFSVNRNSWLRTAEQGTVTLSQGHILRARLQCRNGSWRDAEINLDDHLGNEDGAFDTYGHNFSQTARNTRVEDRRPGKEQVYIIADLQKRDGSWTGTDGSGRDLTNFIKNEDGHFQWNASGEDGDAN